jgi:hypothetical protein
MEKPATSPATRVPPLGPSLPILPNPWNRRGFLRGIVGCGSLAAFPHVWAQTPTPKIAGGYVFHDKDQDGRKGVGDPGLGGIMVSNGRDVVLTDEAGKWQLPLLNESRTDFFIVKPKGWSPPLTGGLLPRHYYLHQPAGSPRQRYPGLPPTGPLPASIDFPLHPQEESDHFRMIICGDPQPRNLREVDFIARSTPSAIREANGILGITLGDVAFDNLSIYPALNQVLASTGIPWRHVIGNHDLNFDSPDDSIAHETFRSTYGPTYYSFDQGEVHFVILNNIRWTGADPANGRPRGSYRAALGEHQLQWLAADLSHVPKEKLVVLFLHIPLTADDGEPAWGDSTDRQELYKLLADRPHTLSFASHRHYHRHEFIGSENGWMRPEAHHHLTVGTLCGSWFRGAPDSFGIPHGTMADGTPRGFIAADFTGNRYQIDGYRAIGAPAGKQMHITLAGDAQNAPTPAGSSFHVNFYNGSERSTLRARCGNDGEWVTLQRVIGPDPHFAALVHREGKLDAPWHSLPEKPGACSHLWLGQLPEMLREGRHTLEIAADDGFGHSANEVRIIQVGV